MMFNWSKGDATVFPVAFSFIILSAVVLRLILGKDVKKRRIPLKIIAIFIICLEISKQIYYNLYEPFTMYVLPLHFCSTFILLIPLAQFTKGKFNDLVKPLPVCYSVIVTALLIAYPRVLLGNSTANAFGSFHNLHTILFHFTIAGYLIYSLVLSDYKPKKSDIVPLVCGIIVYASYSVPVAYIYNVNYVNILRSDFPPFETVRLFFGQFVYDLMLFIVAVSSVILIWLVYYLTNRAFAKKDLKS